MEIGEVKLQLQDHLSDGLVIIAGSGLSVAEGIPGMGALATHLLSRVPTRIESGSEDRWNQISEELGKGADLESTLLKHPPDESLEQIIVDETAELILAAELPVISRVLNDGHVLPLSKLLRHVLKPSTGIPIITTNYDRLIEVAVETSGLAVNSLFVGHNIAKHDPLGSYHSLCRSVERRGRSFSRQFCDHAVVLKPHGSLDWYQRGAEPVRCAFPLTGSRLIITPGLNKFRGGYDQPFDAHRERANREIDKASRFLILGYGFNDEHLQTHLEQQISRGKPTVLITHSLSSNASDLLRKSDNMMAIVSDSAGDGARVHNSGDSEFYPGANLWNLDTFVAEVLE